MIIATAAEYAIIETALKKLDVPSRQVAIDVTIAEVTLTGQFSLGVEWYFSNGSKQGGGLFQSGTNPGRFPFLTVSERLDRDLPLIALCKYEHARMGCEVFLFWNAASRHIRLTHEEVDLQFLLRRQRD